MGTTRHRWSCLCSAALLFGCLVVPYDPAFTQDEPNPQNTPQNAGSPPAQSPQSQKPEDKKDKSSNPAPSAAERTKAATVQAAVATKKAGTAALLKARDWESGWLTGVFVGTGQPLVPLTGYERRAIYLQQTLVTPGAYMNRMFAAGIDEARGAPSQWGGGIGGYSRRSNSLAALGNAKLKYEPRYDQCRCSGFWPRTRHAIMRNFLTYNQSEEELRPQVGPLWRIF